MEGEIYLAFKARLDTWTECYVKLPNVDYKPQAKTPFVMAQFVGLDSDTLILANNCGDEFSGILNLSVFAPVTWTYASHVGLAQRIAGHFPSGHVMTYGGKSVRISRRSKVIGNSVLESNMCRLEVQVYYNAWG